MNKLTHRTVLLLTALAAVALVVGWATLGLTGAVIFIAASLLVSTAAYRGRDRASLQATGARPLAWYEAPELYELVAGLASRAGLPMPRLYLLPGGMVNAVAVANASSSAIGVTAPLLRQLPPAEVAAVIGHELSHIRHGDLPLAMVAAGLAGAAAVMAEVGRFGVIFGWLVGLPVSPIALLMALVVTAGVPALALALRMALSREREYLADAGAAELVGSPDLMAQALWRLDRLNRTTWWQRLFGIRTPAEPTGWASLFSSHPPMAERIARLRRRGGFHGTGRMNPVLEHFSIYW